MQRKTVLITGASRGIGRAIALRLAEEPYNIVITCLHNTDLLLKTKAEVEAAQAARRQAVCGAASSAEQASQGTALTAGQAPQDTAASAGQTVSAARSDRMARATSQPAQPAAHNGPACLAYTGDMGDSACCRELFSMVLQRFGSVDILVNNAGISHIGLLQDMTDEEWDRILRTNLTAAFNLSRLAIPGMVSRKSGRIINISSVWGSAGASCEAAYSATKGAINAFTRALAKELAPSGIQVNAIACGAIDTEMNAFLNEEERNDLISQIPAGRLGSPEEVAELVWQLTQCNAYLTGQVIGLDGGWI